MRRRSNLSQNPTTRPTRWAAPDIIGTISQIHRDANQIEPIGASQNWGGNSLAVGLCRRWLAWLTGSWRGAGQAPSPAFAGGQSVRGHRAGTRPAPTVAAREVLTVVVGGQWLETESGGGDMVGQTCCRGRENKVGSRRGALRGESPRTREGRRPDRPNARRE